MRRRGQDLPRCQSRFTPGAAGSRRGFSSESAQLRKRDTLIRPESMSSGHSRPRPWTSPKVVIPAAWRAGQIDRLLPFRIVPMNGSEARESDLRLKASVARNNKPVRLGLSNRQLGYLIRPPMKKAKRGVSSRLPASPQRGWSGAQILRDGREPRAKLEEIVERLPHRQSSIAHLVGELCEYGARFRSDLAQDEYGPTRAERARR